MKSFHYQVFCSWFAVIVYLMGSVNVAWSVGLREAVAESKQTGKPVLVLGLNPSCPHCEELKKRIKDEPALQALLDQYVVMQTTSLQDPDAQLLLKNYRPKVAGTPVLLGIAPNGAQLFNQAGAPPGDELLTLLEDGLANSAKIVVPQPRKEVRQKAAEGKRPRKTDLLADQKDEVVETAKPRTETSKRPKAKKLEVSGDERAANFLRMARSFSDSEKIRKYAIKAIEAAPDSTHAAAARKLIEKLE